MQHSVFESRFPERQYPYPYLHMLSKQSSQASTLPARYPRGQFRQGRGDFGAERNHCRSGGDNSASSRPLHGSLAAPPSIPSADRHSAGRAAHQHAKLLAEDDSSLPQGSGKQPTFFSCLFSTNFPGRLASCFLTWIWVTSKGLGPGGQKSSGPTTVRWLLMTWLRCGCTTFSFFCHAFVLLIIILIIHSILVYAQNFLIDTSIQYIKTLICRCFNVNSKTFCRLSCKP